MTQAVKTIFLYEAVTAPLKYAIIPIIDKRLGATTSFNGVKYIPTSEFKEHRRDVLLVLGITCLAAPTIEECIFRGVLPAIITYTTGCPEELSLIISGVAFSAFHYTNRQSIADAMCQLSDSYFVYNPLKLAGGLTSSITAHAMHNLIHCLPMLKRTFF